MGGDPIGERLRCIDPDRCGRGRECHVRIVTARGSHAPGSGSMGCGEWSRPFVPSENHKEGFRPGVRPLEAARLSPILAGGGMFWYHHRG